MKKVSFDPNVKIFHMFVWPFAYREARRGENVLDKLRFEIRKQLLEAQLEEIFRKIQFNIKKQQLEAQLDKIGFFSRK